MVEELSEDDRRRIFADLIAGPKPRPIVPELKVALLDGLDPNEAEVVRGILEIVEFGPASIDDLLTELDRKCEDDTPRSHTL
jgi:hypothetical protein